MNKILWLIAFLLLTTNSFAATWYINPDGGTGTQCTGQTDHALSGATGTACRLNSLYWVLPQAGQSTTRQMAGGDTVVVEAGSYRMGCQNATNCQDATINLASGHNCDASQSYNCILQTIPSGSSGTHTKIIGCTTTGCGASTRPELWGAGTIYQILDITGRSFIDLQDLEITDHAACGEGHATLSCGGTGNHPSTLDARDGIEMTNSSDITLTNLNIHGLYRDGLHGGSVGNHIYDNVTVAYNGSAGVNYDSCNNDCTCGVTSGKTMQFKNGTNIHNNGCIENYTGTGAGTIATGGCFEQNGGGYGDGIGGTCSSGTWTFTDTQVNYNTSDGIDLLYFNGGSFSGGTLSIKRSRMEGNNGQQLKSDFNVYVEDSYIIGNCNYFYNKSTTYGTNNLTNFNFCRAFGNTIIVKGAANTGSNKTAKFYNNTISGNGDVLVVTDGTCTGGTVELKNNLLLGGREFRDDTAYFGGGGNDKISITYNSSGTCTATFTEDYNTCSDNFKEASPCPASHSKNNIASSSTYTGTISQGPTTYYTSDNYYQQMTLKSSSTAINAANNALSGADSLGYGSQDRGGTWDMGALDYSAASSPVCGDGVIGTPETCDDSNAVSGDGCSSVCATETGFTCTGAPSTCMTTCGDGIKAGSEGCDDANTTNGDGCNSTCTIESGYTCTGTAPSVCTGAPGTGHPTKATGKIKLSGKITLR